MSRRKNPNNHIKRFRITDVDGLGTTEFFNRDGLARIDLLELSLGFDVWCEVVEFDDQLQFAQVRSKPFSSPDLLNVSRDGNTVRKWTLVWSHLQCKPPLSVVMLVT